jgi:hypothetical protein
MTKARAAIAFAALTAAVGVLRAPALRVGSRAASLGEAREESAYALDGQTVTFPIAAGVRSLRALLNLDLDDALGKGLRRVRVRMTPDGFDETFAVEASQPRNGAVFYLDSATHPSRTLVLGFERAEAVAGSMELSVADPGGRGGVVRVTSLQRRALATADAAWMSTPAAGGAARRRIYFIDGADVPASPALAPTPTGAVLTAGAVAAWTVAGPTTVSLVVVEGRCVGNLATLSSAGAHVRRPIDLDAGHDLAVAIGEGLSTVRVDCGSNVRVALVGPPSAAGSLTHAVALSEGRAELRPRSIVVEAAKTGPGLGPITFDLRGRAAGQPIKVEARALGSELGELELQWRTRDRAGHVVESGRRSLVAEEAPEDRVAGSDARLSDASSFFVWPTTGAAELEISANRMVELSGSSPAWIDDVDATGASSSLPTRLRHGPEPAHRRYFGVRPLKDETLRRENRIDRIVLAPRLEAIPPPVRVAARSISPRGGPPRLEMLVPDRSQAVIPTQVWALLPGQDSPIESPGGTVGVVYSVASTESGATLSVRLDDHVVSEGPLIAARGQLAVAAPPGRHRLRIEAPRTARLFVTRPIVGAPVYRRVGIYEVPPDRPLSFVPSKGEGRHVVGFVLYGRGATDGARVTVQVDRGRRSRAGMSSRDRTALFRTAPLETEPLRDAVLLNTDVAPTWQSRPIFVPLGDDLAPGIHVVVLSIAGARGAIHVRAFDHELGAPSARSDTLALDLGT